MADTSTRKTHWLRLLIGVVAIVIATVVVAPFLVARAAFATVAENLRQELSYTHAETDQIRAAHLAVCRDVDVQSSDLRLRRRGAKLGVVVDLQRTVRFAGVVPYTFRKHLVVVVEIF